MSEPTDAFTDTPGSEIVQFRPRNSLTSKITYAKELAQSGLLPQAYRKNPANVLYAVEFGESLGVSAMTAITGVHVIDGKPTASAALISSLVRRAGHRLRVTGNDEKATAQIIRNDDPDFVFESVWTIDRAKRANLTGKSVWKNYPAAMLKARAINEVARDACEEALNGCHYTPEELGVEVDEEGIPQVEVDWDAEIAACGNDRTKLLDLHARATGNSAAQAKIVAAGKKLAAVKVKPAEVKADETAQPAEPEVVDAEIVEESKSSPEDAVDNLIKCADFDEAEKIRKSGDNTDITALLDQEVCEAIGLTFGSNIRLYQLATKVGSYLAKHKHSVQQGLDMVMGDVA